MTRGEKVIAFIEAFCKVPDGVLVGQPFELLEFQKRFILDVYDNPAGPTRRGILSIARKNGKTALIACLLLAHLVGPEARRNSQIISGARSRDQAALVFDLACKIVQMDEDLADIIKIVPSQKRLVGLTTGVEYKALAAEGKTAHGLSPVLAILDELGQVVGATDPFVDAITTSQGAHNNPLLLVISTQAPADTDMLSLWIDDAAKEKNKSSVCHLYTADENCDVTDEEAWKAANPALGVFNSFDNLQDQAEEADRMPSRENTFRNLCLNQRVSLFSSFVSKSTWQQCGGPVDDEAFFKYPVYAGLDLSARNDLTALVYVCRDDQGIYHVKAEHFTPADTLKEREKKDKAPYSAWVDQLFLTATPGVSVDYSIVAERLAELKGAVNLQKVAFDRWRIDVLKKELADIEADIPLEPFGQGFRDMSPAVESLEAELLQGRVRHGENPVLNMCAVNSVVVKDPAGSRKLDKSKASKRIDGMVALVMAIGVMTKSTDQGGLNDFLFNVVSL